MNPNIQHLATALFVMTECHLILLKFTLPLFPQQNTEILLNTCQTCCLQAEKVVKTSKEQRHQNKTSYSVKPPAVTTGAITLTGNISWSLPSNGPTICNLRGGMCFFLIYILAHACC